MASENSSPGPAFPIGLVGGLVAAVVVIAVAWAALGAEVAIPIAILAVICVIAAVVFRTMGSGGPRAASDSSEGGMPRLPTDEDRPLGDTPQAHDEINPHDFPLYNPGRRTAERMASGPANTTRGMKNGAAAGAGGSKEGETGAVGDDEAGGASTDSAFGPDRD